MAWKKKSRLKESILNNELLSDTDTKIYGSALEIVEMLWHNNELKTYVHKIKIYVKILSLPYDQVNARNFKGITSNIDSIRL